MNTRLLWVPGFSNYNPNPPACPLPPSTRGPWVRGCPTPCATLEIWNSFLRNVTKFQANRNLRGNE